MKKMATKQQGLTFIGLVFVLGFIAIVVLFGLRAFPLYNEKFQVISAMKSVATRPDATELSTKDVRKYFMRSMQVTNITLFTSKNIKDHLQVIKPKKRGEPKIMQLSYESRNKLFSDLNLMMSFDQKMPLSGPSAAE